MFVGGAFVTVPAVPWERQGSCGNWDLAQAISARFAKEQRLEAAE
jgi:hypothetical protein